MKNIFSYLTLATALFITESCAKEIPSGADTNESRTEFFSNDPASNNTGNDIAAKGQCTFRVEPDIDSDGNIIEDTKGSWGGYDTISDINIYVIDPDNDGIVYHQYGAPSQIFLDVDTEKTYDIYIIANAHSNISSPQNVSDLENVSLEFNNYNSWPTTGVPMAKCIPDWDASSGYDFLIRRLVARIAVTFDLSSLDAVNLTLSSVSIKNVPSDIFPFAAQKKCTSVLNTPITNQNGTALVNASLNSNPTPIIFYVLANERGDLTGLGNSTEESDRIPENFEDSDEYPLTTYLELHCGATWGYRLYDNVTYRHFIGTSLNNYNIPSDQSIVNVNVAFSHDSVEDRGWLEEPSDPTGNGDLYFYPIDYSYDDGVYDDVIRLMPYCCYETSLFKSDTINDSDFIITAVDLTGEDDIANAQYFNISKDPETGHYIISPTSNTFASGYYCSDGSNLTPISQTYVIRTKDDLIRHIVTLELYNKPFGVRFIQTNKDYNYQNFTGDGSKFNAINELSVVMQNPLHVPMIINGTVWELLRAVGLNYDNGTQSYQNEAIFASKYISADTTNNTLVFLDSTFWSQEHRAAFWTAVDAYDTYLLSTYNGATGTFIEYAFVKRIGYTGSYDNNILGSGMVASSINLYIGGEFYDGLNTGYHYNNQFLFRTHLENSHTDGYGPTHYITDISGFYSDLPINIPIFSAADGF